MKNIILVASLMILTGIAGALVGKFQHATNDRQKAWLRNLRVIFPVGFLSVILTSFIFFKWYLALSLFVAQFAVVSAFRWVLLTKLEHGLSDKITRKIIIDKIEEQKQAGNTKVEGAIKKILDLYDIWFSK